MKEMSESDERRLLDHTELLEEFQTDILESSPAKGPFRFQVLSFAVLLVVQRKCEQSFLCARNNHSPTV